MLRLDGLFLWLSLFVSEFSLGLVIYSISCPCCFLMLFSAIAIDLLNLGPSSLLIKIASKIIVYHIKS